MERVNEVYQDFSPTFGHQTSQCHEQNTEVTRCQLFGMVWIPILRGNHMGLEQRHGFDLSVLWGIFKRPSRR